MKLLVMWLLGVPVLVGSMVVARSLPMQAVQAELQLPASNCQRQDNLHPMRAIAQQRDRVACNPLAVQ